MLNDKELKVFIPTKHPDKAKAFYGAILGLILLSEDDYAVEFDANGTRLRVIIVEELKPHPFTVLGWNVPDIDATIKQLNSRGITCEQFGFMEQDPLGIWIAPDGSKVCWFKDPDGNVLSLTQII